MAWWEQEPDELAEDEGPVIAHAPVRDDSELDITPMIDITFLLLIFFLVATTNDLKNQVDLPGARYGKLAAVYSSVVVTIVDREGPGRARVYAGDGVSDASRLLADDPEQQEQQLRDWVENGVLRENKTAILVKAARNVRHADVARVSRVCVEAAGGGQPSDVPLHLAVLEVE